MKKKLSIFVLTMFVFATIGNGLLNSAFSKATVNFCDKNQYNDMGWRGPGDPDPHFATIIPGPGDPDPHFAAPGPGDPDPHFAVLTPGPGDPDPHFAALTPGPGDPDPHSVLY